VCDRNARGSFSIEVTSATISLSKEFHKKEEKKRVSNFLSEPEEEKRRKNLFFFFGNSSLIQVVRLSSKVVYISNTFSRARLPRRAPTVVVNLCWTR
jgi:hypothetical protein